MRITRQGASHIYTGNLERAPVILGAGKRVVLAGGRQVIVHSASGLICRRQGEAQIAPPERLHRRACGTSRWREQAEPLRQGDARIFMAVTGARTGASSAYMRRMGQAQGESAVRGLTGVFRKGVANVYNSATASRQGEARYVWELIRNRRHGRYRVFNENMLTLAIRAQARIIYPAPGLGISADPAITIRAEVELVSPIRAEAQILRGAPNVH